MSEVTKAYLKGLHDAKDFMIESFKKFQKEKSAEGIDSITISNVILALESLNINHEGSQSVN